MNEDNLKPFNELSESEQREIRSKGGIRSGEVRREKKLVKSALEAFANGKPIKAVISNLKKTGMSNKELKALTNIEALIKYAGIKGFSKDAKLSDVIKLIELIRDTLGEKPKEKLEFESNELKIFVADEKHKQMLEDL